MAARRWSSHDVLDAVFFVVAALFTLVLAGVLLSAGWSAQPVALLYVVLFWAVLAYLALPRLHQVLTWLYVPDYFIGRTRTADGLLGDPVNLAVLGDEASIHAAMTAAGWVRADPITMRSSWGIIVASLLRRSYAAAPVSTLLLFGRGQDFAYQKEVEGNPAQRHHIRFWRVPEGWVLPGGGRIDWLAAATYDRSVGLSTLTFQVTHKIDADIDIERDYVVDDVLWANQDAYVEVWPDVFTSYHDKNGGGDRVVTDGTLHVLDLTALTHRPPASGSDDGAAVGGDPVRGARSGAGEGSARAAGDGSALPPRPRQLLGALVLLALLEVANVVRLQSIVVPEALRLTAPDPTDSAWVLVLLVAVIQVAVVALLAALAVATWMGHPRSRICLMVLLSLTVASLLAEVLAVGASQAPGDLLVCAALGTLTLLALSARPCQQWVRVCKAARSVRRGGARAESA